MRKASYFVVLFFLISETSGKPIADTSRSGPRSFVFKKYDITTEKGIENFALTIDSMSKAETGTPLNDSLLQIIKSTFPEVMAMIQEKENKLIVEVRNDSIWRQVVDSTTMIGDFQMVLKDRGVLYFYNKDRTFNYNRHDLFADSAKYKVLENKNDRKTIMGFDCFKLRLIMEHDESMPGSTIYEMYVTDKIKLPVHAVLNIGILIPDLFPLEIRIREENLNGLEEVYEIIGLR